MAQAMTSAGGVADDAGVEAEGLQDRDRKTAWKQPCGARRTPTPSAGGWAWEKETASPQRAEKLQP